MTMTDVDVIDWWEWHYIDAWETAMRDDGYVVLPDDWKAIPEGDRRVAMVAEQRWTPCSPHEVGSRLWDGCQIAMPQVLIDRRARLRRGSTEEGTEVGRSDAQAP